MPFLASRENVLVLIYLAVALGLVGNAVYFTEANAQWLRASQQLETVVHGAKFNLQSGSSTPPSAIVNATLNNPSDIGGIFLLTAYYQVFVNSTKQDSAPLFLGSTVVATGQANYQQTIQAHSSLDLSTTIPITKDILQPVTNFIRAYNSTLVVFVGIDLQVQSSYISISVSSCTQLPGQTATVCPSLRPVPGGGGGGA